MFFMVDKIEKLDDNKIPETPSSTVGSRLAYYAKPAKNFLQNKLGFGANWIMNIVGAGEARTLDGNTEKFAEKKQKLENIKHKYEGFSLQGGNKSENDDERNLLNIKSLKTLREASDGLEDALELRRGGRAPDQLEVLMEASLKEDLKKFLTYEEEELRKKNVTFISANSEKNAKEIDSLEQKNMDAIKSRIFFSLIFFGIFEALEVTSSILGNFGGEFSDSIGRVLRDPNSMGPFAEINKAFGVDKIFEGLSQIPILNDINQFGVDALSTEYTQPFAEIANSLIKSEGLDLALKGAILAYQLSNEIDLYKEYSKTQKNIGNAIKEIEGGVEKNTEMVIEKIAENIIEKQENARLDTIYLRDFLRNKDGGLREINKKRSSVMKIMDAQILDQNGSARSLYDWLIELQNIDGDERDKKLQTFIVLLTLPENIKSLKVLNEVIKNSIEIDGDEIRKEKKDVLKQFITDSNCKEMKAFLAKSHENFAQDKDSSKDEFIDKILSMPRKDVDEIIVEIAKIARKDQVVFNIKENSFQPEVSSNLYNQKKDNVDRFATRVLRPENKETIVI
jgi:hypothetical protein